jgi:hypothetical protein
MATSAATAAGQAYKLTPSSSPGLEACIASVVRVGCATTTAGPLPKTAIGSSLFSGILGVDLMLRDAFPIRGA